MRHRSVGIALLATWLLPAVAAAAPITLVGRASAWRWYAGPAEPAGAWRSEPFDDSAWPTGPAPLGYGEARIATVVPDGGDPANRWITTYFRREFTLGVSPGAVLGAAFEADYDDGFVATLNGVEIARRHLPGGPIAWGTLASDHESGTFETIVVPPTALVAGVNVLAVELHQRIGSSSDLLWDGAFSVDTTTVSVTRGPYLQMATPTGITIRWRTSVPVVGRVHWGPAPGPFANTIDEAAASTEHLVRLEGLEPATAYVYAVATTDESAPPVDPATAFSTMTPAGTAAPMRLWVIGDSGLGNADGRRVRDAYLAWAGARREDVFVLLGDNAYGTGLDSEYQAGFFDQYPQILRRTPAWPTRGNHDLLYAGLNNDYYDIFSLPTAGESGGVPSGTEAWYAYDWGPVHFICLDSEGSDRSTGGAMLQWLRADLSATTQPWVIAYWHHPPYTKGSHDSDNNFDSGGRMRDMRENVIPILDSLGVDLVLTGHSHAYERSLLLDGHTGPSGTLTPAMKLDAGDGRPNGNGPYQKPSPDGAPHEGAVYAVNGSAAQISGGSLSHPAMVSSLNVLGSMVIDVDGLRLDARFIDDQGAVRDSFRIVKGTALGVEPAPPAARIQLAPPTPSPFSARTRVTFATPASAHARLDVIDVGGRLVRTLADGPYPAGRHVVTWDGRDRAGARVRAGSYLLVLTVAEERVVRRIVRLP